MESIPYLKAVIVNGNTWVVMSLCVKAKFNAQRENLGMVQKRGILVNTMRDEFSPFWYALFVHMMFKNLGNLCDSFKSLKT